MTDDDKKWIKADDAVELIMQRTHCSRRNARRKLARMIGKKKLTMRNYPIPRPPLLEPEDADEMLADDPTSVMMSLDELMSAYGFDVADIMAELRSGRLVVSPLNESVMIQAELQGGGSLPASQFVVRGDKLLDWMVHPQTPQHLRDRMGHKPPH